MYYRFLKVLLFSFTSLTRPRGGLYCGSHCLLFAPAPCLKIGDPHSPLKKPERTWTHCADLKRPTPCSVSIWMKRSDCVETGVSSRPIRPSPSLRLCASGWLILSCIFSVRCSLMPSTFPLRPFSVPSILKIVVLPHTPARHIFTSC